MRISLKIRNSRLTRNSNLKTQNSKLNYNATIQARRVQYAAAGS